MARPAGGDKPLSPSLTLAMTKADYDRFVEETGRRPGDSAARRGMNRGQITNIPTRSDQQLRPKTSDYVTPDQKWREKEKK